MQTTGVRLLFVSALLLHPGVSQAETSGTFGINGKQVQVHAAYAYDFPFLMPAGDGAEPEALRVIALSDRPFDAAALDRVCQPDVDIDARAQSGALVLNLLYAPKGGALRMIKYRAPGMSSFANTGPETDDASLRLEKASDGAVRGRLTIKGNAHMHEFDPANIPLVTADVAIDAAAPVSREVKGAALPAGGGDPGKVYLAFNQAIAGKDPKPAIAMMRAGMQPAFAEMPEGNPFEEIMIVAPKIESGTSDGKRARLRVSGKDTKGAASSLSVCLVVENDAWKIDSFIPGE